MTMISRIDYHRIARFAPAAYIGSWILSGAVLLVGDAYNGSRRWLSIGPLSFQPSEFAKPAVILFLSHLISKKEKVGNGLGSLIWCIMLVLPIVALVGTNNLSTAIIILGIAVILAFVSRPGYAQFLWIGLAGTGVVTIFLMMEQYRLERLVIWKNPEAHEKGFQTIQGLYAIGSGGLYGKGAWAEGTLTHLNYVPENHTDFIFSVVGETLGFVGSLVLLGLYAFVIFRMLLLAYHTHDRFGQLVIVGVMAMLMFHVLENIGMCIGVMPITGIPLPFISYGGTNLVVNMAGIGLVLNVTKYKSSIDLSGSAPR